MQKPQDLAAVEAKVLQLLAEESAGASAADMFALQQHYRQAAQEAIYMQVGFAISCCNLLLQPHAATVSRTMAL